jgi:hypothetical protein
MKAIHILAVLLAFQFSANAQVFINEICASNGDVKYETDFYDFPGYVELYNAGSAGVSVANYYLTDDPSQKNKWRIPSGTSIPAKGYLIIWCDDRNSRLHTNFNLDADGEVIILSNSSSTEIDRVEFPEQYINISYGRTADGGAKIGYLTSPTPGAQNNDQTGAVRLENPNLSLKSGRYASSQSLSMDAAGSGAEIRYTTDGSEPTSSSPLYGGAFNITKTTTVKAKSFREGYLPSKTEVKTYFINEHAFTLPVVSISAKPAYLFDNTIGILVDGTNGTTGNCTDQPRNWNQDWDRHAVFEYFDKTGEKYFDQNIDIRIYGACSRNNPQKSLVLRARDKFGSSTIEHEFFKSKAINNFGAIVLRNAGNDFYYTMFRDALMQHTTVGQMDLEYLGYQPSIVYLNGAYWGIENIREKIDGDYFEANFGIDKDDVDILEGGGTAIEGTRDRYSMYLDSLQKISLSSPEAFAFINRYIDVQNFINYLTTEIYYANTDWPGNNVKFWRQRSTNGKFRWILWDLDFGMGLYQDRSYPTHRTLDFATDPASNVDWPNPPWSTLHIRLLLQNPEFRSKLIQTMTTSLNTAFKPERISDLVTSFQNTIKAEMPYHVQRWNLNIDTWNWEVNRLKTFATERNNFMKSHIAEFFGLGDNVRINVKTFPAQSGTVLLNGISNSTVEDAFYFRDLRFDAEAKPNAGYTFSHYKVRKNEATRISLIQKGATWKYNDQGALAASDWSADTYSDAAWQQGPAELGYGDTDEATTVGYGGNINNKFITTYFRKAFSVADTTGFSALSGSVLFDDGVVIYLNGEEIYRNNMPAGAITNNTLASAGQDAETTFFGFSIPKGKVKIGTNVLAVEVHQNVSTSSDISFNLELSAVQSGAETEYTVNDIALSDIANSDVSIEAYFTAAAVSSGIVINEFSAENSILEDEYGDKDDWIEIHNKGDEAVDIENYFISDALSTKLKHRIPKGKKGETIIAPGAYKILWADDDVEQGPLHLGFKLSDEGEELGIYQLSGTSVEIVDEVTFNTQKPLTSFSRIPNITGSFTQTAITTPLAENVFEAPLSVENENNSLISVYPNPSNGHFYIRSQEEGMFSVEVFNISGRQIRNINGFLSGEQLSLSGEPHGMYLIRIKSGNKVEVRKVVKI